MFQLIKIGKETMDTCKTMLGQVESWSKKHSNPLIRTTVAKEYGRVFYVKVLL